MITPVLHRDRKNGHRSWWSLVVTRGSFKRTDWSSTIGIFRHSEFFEPNISIECSDLLRGRK